MRNPKHCVTIDTGCGLSILWGPAFEFEIEHRVVSDEGRLDSGLILVRGHRHHETDRPGSKQWIHFAENYNAD